MKIKKIVSSAWNFAFNSSYRFKKMNVKGFYKNLSDEKFLKKAYKSIMGKKLDLSNPQTFNEKLQWLKLYDRKPIYTTMVDKYAVKQYVADIIGEEYIIPTLGVWDRFEDIDFDALPNQFVLKCTHDSGGLVICKDKSQLNREKAKKKINSSLKTNFYLKYREWPYKDVPRKIIAEKYMEDSTTQELRDYKFFCFNGVCKCFKVDFDRFIEHGANYYDMKLNYIDVGEIACPPKKEKEILFPEKIKEMINFAEKLSSNIPFLRIDFYNVDGKIFFGEITFYPNSGMGAFVDEEWDYTFGSWVKLPDIAKK